MTDQTSPEDMFKSLREQLFGADLSALVPAEGAGATDGHPEIYGVVMEGGLEGGSYLVFGLRDGTSSLYFSGGGGAIGGGEHAHINAAAREFVETAGAFSKELPRVSEYPIPSDGRVRFSIFTSAGVLADEVAEDDLASGEHRLMPLFAAGQAIITGFRVLEEPESADEPSYVNCLLTVLARGTASSVVLDPAASLPDPARLTQDEQDLEWIERLGFDFSTLSPSDVIQMIEDQADINRLQSEGEFNAKVAGHEEDSFTDVTFHVRRRNEGGGQVLEITVQRTH